MFHFSVLDQKKIQNLMREGGKKENLQKKTLNLFLERLMRATKKNKQKKHSWEKIFFYLLK